MLKLFIILIIVLLLGFVVFSFLIARYNLQKKSFLEFWQIQSKIEGELLYIALGDSTSTGIGATNPQNSYVWRIKSMYEKKLGKRVRIVNIGFPGAKTQDLIENQLPQLSKYKEPDLVTVSIGANDSNHDLDPEIILGNLESIIEKLPKGSYVAEIPAIRGKNRDRTVKINIKLKLLAARKNINIVPLYEPLLEHINDISIYDIDFFHPNNKGYGIWTKTFWSTINKNE